MKAQERRNTREEDPRLRTLLSRLLVQGRQVPHQDLPRGRTCARSDLLAAVGQSQHLRDQHGRIPGCGGNRGTLPADTPDLDRALPRARGRDRRVLIGEVLAAAPPGERCPRSMANGKPPTAATSCGQGRVSGSASSKHWEKRRYRDRRPNNGN